MRRRDFITGVAGSAAAWPLATRAQQPAAVRRIGFLHDYDEQDSEGRVQVAAFREALGARRQSVYPHAPQQIAWPNGAIPADTTQRASTLIVCAELRIWDQITSAHLVGSTPARRHRMPLVW
jgi:hypothetical protein